MPTDKGFTPIILAGGSGTRFWPRSRRSSAKQVLALDGERTLIQQTVDRLAPMAERDDVWVITNDLLAETIEAQLSGVPSAQVLREPAARNTAPAAGLAAFLLEKTRPETVLGMFPADQVVADEPKFREVIAHGVALAAAGENIVVLGIRPTRAETGYGYIETGDVYEDGVLRVRRFLEKPNAAKAEEFVAAGNYFWNGGIFLWSARTLANAIREHFSETAPLLERIAAAHGRDDFETVFAELYPQCENISVDYAILEPRSAKGEHHSNLYCLPSDFGWNDLGSWTALYEHREPVSADEHGNVVETDGGRHLNATGNYVYAPKKFVSLIGVSDLVVVETDDVILVTTRHHAQDVGKIAKQLVGTEHDHLT